MLSKIIHYFLYNRLVTMLLLIFMIGWGVVTSPFDWNFDLLRINLKSCGGIEVKLDICRKTRGG
ncbi:hypothetical protein [Salinimicrobium terrae]|uniref:hypothetical protein n=1 Tax=Salinimicrobium terrae TaxID=470866 RepID=UPI00040DA56F|nr:hypothetical protein [Salinimicrobium terrae]